MKPCEFCDITEAELDRLPIRFAGHSIGGKSYVCAFCGGPANHYADRDSVHEAKLHHSCQKCQDNLFGKAEPNAV